MRPFISNLTLAVLILSMGCVTVPKTPPQSLEERYGNIAIVPARYAPETAFITFTRSPLTGAVKGAGVGAGSGLWVGLEAAPYEPLAGVLVGIILLPVTVPLGAIGGLTAYTPKETAQRIELLLDDAVKKEKMPVQLGKRVVREAVYFPQVQQQLLLNIGPDQPRTDTSYKNLVQTGIDTVLELGMAHIGFEGGSPDREHLRIFMIARSRLIRTKDNSVITEREYRYDSPAQTISNWTLHHGQPLIEAFHAGYSELANRIASKLLEQSPYWPFRTPVKRFTRSTNEGYCGLKPLNPKYQYRDGPR